jgi:hypothetical protein
VFVIVDTFHWHQFQDSDGTRVTDAKFRTYLTKCWEKFEPTVTDRWCTLATWTNVQQTAV